MQEPTNAVYCIIWCCNRAPASEFSVAIMTKVQSELPAHEDWMAHTHTLKQTESQKNMFLEINFLGNWMKIADGRHVARYIHAWFHLQNSCVHELDHTNTYLSTDTHIQHSLSWSKQYLRIHIVWLLMWCAWCGNGVWSMMPTVWGMNTVSWGTMSSLAFTLCQVTLHVKREIKIMKMEMHQTTIKIRKRAWYDYLTPSDKSQIM